MSTFIAHQNVSLRDCRGHVGKSSFHYRYQDTDAAHIANARTGCSLVVLDLEAISNALVVGVSGPFSQTFNPLSYGANVTYANSETKARLTYLTQADPSVAGLDAFTTVHIDVPAPIAGIFLADQETVDPANAAIALLTTQLLSVDATGGFACNRSGGPFVAFVGGVLVRRKFQRKLTIWDKSAKLDEPEV